MTCCTRGFARAGLAGFVLLLIGAPLRAQDLEPRAYAASPIGVHFLVAGWGRSSGGVVVDPSLPVEDVEAVVGSMVFGGGTTFSLLGRSALLVGALPLARAQASGRIGEDARSITRSGLADPRIKLSVNLLGGRALKPREFARARRPTIAGVSLSVVTPGGQYDRTKLINLGANRWSFKPEFGISHAIRRWTIEGYTGVWLFTTNDTFYTGSSTRTQQPVVALQAHASYTLRPRMWFAFDGTWYSGGATRVDGVAKADLQRNSRLGATLSVPLTARQSAKIAFSTGATTRIGGDFNTVAVLWQLSWISRE
jgi:outer membrane putative beta-barrel porin/alpha-amylase